MDAFLRWRNYLVLGLEKKAVIKAREEAQDWQRYDMIIVYVFFAWEVKTTTIQYTLAQFLPTQNLNNMKMWWVENNAFGLFMVWGWINMYLTSCWCCICWSPGCSWRFLVTGEGQWASKRKSLCLCKDWGRRGCQGADIMEDGWWEMIKNLSIEWLFMISF